MLGEPQRSEPRGPRGASSCGGDVHLALTIVRKRDGRLDLAMMSNGAHVSCCVAGPGLESDPLTIARYGGTSGVRVLALGLVSDVHPFDRGRDPQGVNVPWPFLGQ